MGLGLCLFLGPEFKCPELPCDQELAGMGETCSPLLGPCLPAPLIFPPGPALRACPFYRTHTEQLLLPGIQWSVTQRHLIPPSRLEPDRPHTGTNNYLHILCSSCTSAWKLPEHHPALQGRQWNPPLWIEDATWYMMEVGQEHQATAAGGLGRDTGRGA